jgi:hypothetical protein
MVGSLVVCCAAAANGHVTAPKSVMKSRRLIFTPVARVQK